MSPFVFCIISVTLVLSEDFPCTSYTSSSASCGADQCTTSSSCPSGTMMSCGVRTKSTTATKLDGAYISGANCIAENGEGASGVYAHTQCCTIPTVYDIQCTNLVATFTTSSSIPSQAICTGDSSVLTGCSVRGGGDNTDGSWIGTTYPSLISSRNTLLDTNNICNAFDGSPGSWGVGARATCCETASTDHTLDCKYIISSNSGTVIGNTASVSCPNGHAMSGCSGVSGVITAKSINAWYISNNVCIARNSKSKQYVVAMAICCQIVTAAPTNNPTTTPTFNPTNYPTNESTINPSHANPIKSSLEAIININVTINKLNISTVTSVINDIKESVNNYMNGLSVNINYTLTVNIINIQMIFFQLYTSDSDRKYIDVYQLDEDVSTSLNNNFGDGVVNVVVTQVDHDKQTVYQARKTFYQQITGIIAAFCVIVFIIALIDAKIIRRNDYFKVDLLIIGAIQTLDCISDILFIILIRYHPEFVFIFSFSTPLCILFTSSVFFILVSIIFTLYQLHYVMNKYWLKNDILRSWLNKYTCAIYAISFITGTSFAAVQICSSGAFGVHIFSMPLSINDRASFLYRRIYSVLLMENIPQLALAIWFIMATHSHIDEMVYICMVFSVISILMSFLTLCASKKLVKTQDHCHISLDVTGDMFDVKKIKFCSQNTNDIKNRLSVLLGLQPSMVEILRPLVISCGLKITILLYISNEKYDELKIKHIIDEQHQKGRLAIIFNNSWNLSLLPDINNIMCQQIASKQRAKMHNNMATHEMLSKNKEGKQLIIVSV